MPLLPGQRGDDPPGRPRPREDGRHPRQADGLRRRPRPRLGRPGLPGQVPHSHPQRGALVRRGPSLQRAGGRLPLHPGRDAQARPRPSRSWTSTSGPTSSRRSRTRRAGSTPSAGVGYVAIFINQGKARRRHHRPSAHPAGHHPKAASRRRVGGRHRPELAQRAGDMPHVPGRGLRDGRAQADPLDGVLHRVRPVGLRPLPTSSGSTRSGTRPAC